MTSLALLLAAVAAFPLGLRLLARTGIPALRPTHTQLSWFDLPLAVLAGCLAAGLSYSVLAAEHSLGPVFDDDFRQFCTTVATLTGVLPPGVEPYVLRPAFPSLPAALLSEHISLLRAMVTSSTAAVGVIAAATWLCGTAIAGRVAGAVGAALVPAFGPIASGTLQLTIYPELGALYMLCALSAVLTVTWRGWAGLVVGGTGVGLAMLGDQFSLLWAAPAAALVVLSALQKRPRLPRLACALAPVALSFLVANQLPPEVYFFPDERPPNLNTLQLRLSNQAAIEAAVWAPSDGTEGPAGEHTATLQAEALTRLGQIEQAPGFAWGRGGPLELLDAVASAIPVTTRGAEPPAANGELPLLVWRQAMPGIAAIALGLLATLWRWRHRPWMAAAVVSAAAPFAVWLMVMPSAGGQPVSAWAGLSGFEEGTKLVYLHSKFLLLGDAFAPCMLGVAWAVLAGDRTEPVAPDRRAWVRVGLSAAGALVLLLGWIPSAVGPDTPWKVAYNGDSGALRRALTDAQLRADTFVAQGRPQSDVAMHPLGPCDDRLMRDLAADPTVGR